VGTDIYKSTTEIDTKLIGNKIFNNEKLLNQLNSIIHPAVNVFFNEFVKENESEIVIIESALLFEVGINKQVNKTITVFCPDEIRIKRVMKRDGLSKDAVLVKLASQMPQEEKMALSDFVLLNNEEILLLPQIVQVFEKLKIELK
jgi:dephospho-CoA kinase